MAGTTNKNARVRTSAEIKIGFDPWPTHHKKHRRTRPTQKKIGSLLTSPNPLDPIEYKDVDATVEISIAPANMIMR